MAREKFTDVSSLRGWITETVKPLLPNRWALVPYLADIDAPSVPTVAVKLQSIVPLPQAPKGTVSVSYVFTVIEPHTDAGTADRALDDDLLTFIAAISNNPSLAWTDATAVAFDDVHLAYDVTVQAVTSLTPKE
ncbi:hypothetical protein [Curtobacterium poinsettiae]|uniref:hypothetical protein n=1 Tax=Curtobacterium TaxID=2034 RepID=UPI00217F043B|nr:hypothetical protein [Curtobacterium flaccumfaciens]MCS6563433.1 hypothetical protein [Curtobacterium flaccumfaciens pv. poinsettiae]UXN30317.1 hypothetical protein N8D75_08810 [Curtobacterium flaccumfaciens]